MTLLVPTPIMNMLCFMTMMMLIMGTVHSQADVYNVLDYGAISSDEGDSSEAFLNAWNFACADTSTPIILIPETWTFLVYPITFQGPCKSENVVFMVSGTIVAPDSPDVWTGHDASRWLQFNGIKGLIVDGNGLIDGRGKGWWDQSCKLNPKLENCTTLAPTALSFVGCNEGVVRNIYITNSSQTHIYLGRLQGFSVDSIRIRSPGYSPNTDGIHIQAVSDLVITNSIIASGDDCISVGDYTSNIWISRITCGPGHGISIGSLGRGGNNVQVSEIHVSDSLFDGTTNGARIKTWQVGKGYAQNITFRNLQFSNVKNPIIIDQNYCIVRGGCDEEETGVKIRNVTYTTMFGTSSSNIAINLNCSRSVACSEIVMESIRLAHAVAGKEVRASCNNAYGQEIDVVPGPCLLNSLSTSPM